MCRAPSSKPPNQFEMKKKSLFLMVALAAAGLAQAQDKKAPPPPPPVIEKHDAPPPPPAPKAVAEHPAPPPPPPAPPPPQLPKDYKAFLQRNPSVVDLHWSNGGNTVIVSKNNGTKESYDLNDAAQLEQAEARYGKFPKAAPPPPPKVIRKIE